MSIDAASLIIFLVLAAAAMHAAWNALLFAGGDQLAKTQLLILMYVIVGVFLVIFAAKSTVIEIVEHSWPWLAVSAVGHVFYYFGLGQSYRHREFAAVYGVMRGVGPIFITAGAIFLGQWPSPFAAFAILVVSFGVFLLKWSGVPAHAQRAFSWAIVTAFGTATSILADGSGVKQLPDQLGFFGCSLIGGAVSSLIVFALLGYKWKFSSGIPARRSSEVRRSYRR